MVSSSKFSVTRRNFYNHIYYQMFEQIYSIILNILSRHFSTFYLQYAFSRTFIHSESENHVCRFWDYMSARNGDGDVTSHAT